MKMKVWQKLTEQKNGGNANHIYGIIWYKLNLPGAVDLAVAVDVAVVVVYLCDIDALIF